MLMFMIMMVVMMVMMMMMMMMMMVNGLQVDSTSAVNHEKH